MDVHETLNTAANLLIADIVENAIQFARYGDNYQNAERELIANGNALYFIRQAIDSLDGWND